MLRNRIRSLREARGWSQSELARRVGTSQVEISRLETGERKLTEDWMRRLANALDVRPVHLFETLALAELDDDVVADDSSTTNGVIAAMARRNVVLVPYKVTSNAVELAGITRGDTIVVDSGIPLADLPAADVALFRATRPDGTDALILRAFLPPQTAARTSP